MYQMCKTVLVFFFLFYPIRLILNRALSLSTCERLSEHFLFKAHINCTQVYMIQRNRFSFLHHGFGSENQVVCGFCREHGISSMLTALQRLVERVSDIRVLVKFGRA